MFLHDNLYADVSNVYENGLDRDIRRKRNIMGWANGELSNGKQVGYGVLANCEEPYCMTDIDRGLAFACGGSHGEDEYSCDRYFCYRHLLQVVFKDGTVTQICNSCFKHANEEGLLLE